MSSTKPAINSLLTEHFQYTPLTLVDDIINIVNEIVYRAVGGVEQGLSDTAPSTLGFEARYVAEGRTAKKDANGGAIYPEVQVEIDHGVHQLETLLESTVDRNFDKLEIYVLRNILNVPEELAPWIKLGHYEGLDFSQKPNAPTPEVLFKLRRKLQETQRLNHALVAEQARNAAVISQLQALVEPQASGSASKTPNLAFITSSEASRRAGIDFNRASDDHHPLKDDTAKAVAQLPALRKILTVLRPIVDTLPKAAQTSSTADERREYIETQTRRQLEKQGIDVDTGEGLTGPPSQGGFMIDKEKVGSVEGIVEMISKNSGSKSAR